MAPFDQKAWKRAYNREWMRWHRQGKRHPGRMWRHRAEEARTRAEAMTDADRRLRWLRIAEGYDALAEAEAKDEKEEQDEKDR